MGTTAGVKMTGGSIPDLINVTDTGYSLEPAQVEAEFNKALETIKELNRLYGSGTRILQEPVADRKGRLKKVLIANRGEIAKRFFLALHEENIQSVAVVTDPDQGQSWYEFADEVVFIGDASNYADPSSIIAAAVFSGANAIYSGYGFLSESSQFVERISILSQDPGRELIFMGPDFRTMRLMGDKVSARKLVSKHDIALFESSRPFTSPDIEAVRTEAERIGYPVIVKLSSGGGGKGMYPVLEPGELEKAVESSCRIGAELYNDTSFYLEKFITRPVHIEVQIFNGNAIGIRKCAVQRRNQKIIEESGHTFLDDYMSLSLFAAAEKIAFVSGYSKGGGAGTVEFLIDSSTGKFGFMEMNTRLQVEYAVTDQSLGIDLVKWQILHFDGRSDRIEKPELIKYRILERNHAIQCRIYAEEPERNYMPSTGTIVTIELPTFNGIRCDFGFARGDRILPTYDPMIGKLIANGATRNEALIRMERALQEFYIRGVRTNVNQLLRVIRHPAFIKGDYTNNLLDEHDELSYRNNGELSGGDEPSGYMDHVVLGCFVEYIKLLNDSIINFSIIAAFEGVAESSAVKEVPWQYNADYCGEIYSAEFIQISMDTFLASANGKFQGSIIVESFNERNDDFLVIYKNSSLRVRADRLSGLLVLRMKDFRNKIKYYRMKVSPAGRDETAAKGIVRSPFQGTFVSFCGKDPSPGDRVNAGDPLIILSSMKMETTITAPVSGHIKYAISEGDSTKLQLGRTPQGRIIGRSIKEGELLFRIEPEASGEKDDSSNKKTVIDINKDSETLDILRSERYEELILPDIEKHFDFMVHLFLSAVKGYMQYPALAEKLVTLLEKIPVAAWKAIINDERANIINDILIHYTNIRRLFSPVVYDDGFSFPDELDRYVTRWQNQEIKLHPRFRQQIDELLAACGISSLQSGTHVERMRSMHFFLLLKQSSQFSLNYWKRVGTQVHVVAGLAPHLDKTMLAIKRLFKHTQTESDDSSYKRIRKIVTTFYPDKTAMFFSSRKDDSGISVIQMPEPEKPAAGEPFFAVENELVPRSISTEFSSFINERLDRLALEWDITRFTSGHDEVLFYRITSRDTSGSCYCAISSCGNTAGKDGISEKLENCAAAVSSFQRRIPLAGNWIELFVSGTEFTLDETSDTSRINRSDLKKYSSGIAKYFYDGTIKYGIMRMKMLYPLISAGKNIDLVLAMRKDDIVFDILSPGDRRNIYYSPELVRGENQKLFDMDKWPIEEWAEHSLDPGSMKEITIPSIDQNAEKLIVGSKIYEGKINGREVLYYMKDFRINGGATGDLEGRKYCAAAYIAGIKGLPLYVWNDSAGANIRQGMVSLNRGAQGFMMNSLIAGNTGRDEFLKYINAVPDPVLRSLFGEINGIMNFDAARDYPHKSMVIAVGIGASAGLDVYGSSQATFQILMNSDSSYRVLTGSNVIQSVMGENISNYEIGGAQVLGKWAGIVDSVPEDRLDVIYQVRQLLYFFTTENLTEIRRVNPPSPAGQKIRGLIITEHDILKNVDDAKFRALKEDYYGANALIGGIAKLAGCGVLIMASRTNSGLTMSASIIKARELLRMAYRTGMHQIFIFGKRWHHIRRNHENLNMRARYDFTKALYERRGLRINIITDIEGLKNTDINSPADAIIFVENRMLSDVDKNFIQKNSTFVVKDLDYAFDLSAKIISMVERPFIDQEDRPAGLVSIPDDPSEPYDIITSVIEPVFDSGSFTEFGREMNNPVTGPTLVTGLARIRGRAVGIIADQPLTRGGGADAAGTEKFRVFVEFLNRHSLPVIMLFNSSGFVPGSKEERFRIQSIGAESLDANILGHIPAVSVILNQNYGGRLIQAFNGYLRPGIVYIARANAMMSVLGATAAFDLLHRKNYTKLLDEGKTAEAENLQLRFHDEYTYRSRASNDAISTGVLDWIIDDIRTLADHIARGLELAEKRCMEAFGENKKSSTGSH
jgi:acetyl/propionyl-CoA carboxylase alpha subunit/acetyl-CoA carboxylase carboxyltransferase component